MAGTIKQFNYKIIKMKKTDQMPFSPIVILNLDHWTGDDGDAPQVSPHLMTEDEIDARIIDLKADLDAVGQRAKRALTNAKAATSCATEKGMSCSDRNRCACSDRFAWANCCRCAPTASTAAGPTNGS